MEDNSTVKELIDNAKNLEILKSFLVTNNKLKGCNKAMCAISGGSDSDIMLDICSKFDTNNKITYVFFDTGLEYQATKEHLKYLEEKYSIEIKRYKAVKPIPICCKEYGVPFLSKQVSEMICRLQKYNFKWEDKSFDELYAEYPKCKVALKWWCNNFGEKSKFNIERNSFLKEFMIANPPQFKISNKCCHYAKKLVAKHAIAEQKCDLNIYGVRKAEGGARATAYKNCYTPATDDEPANYRPIFWYTDETKKEYESSYDIQHSDCYKVWGLPRTGCSGCPYARDFENELELVKKYEPKLYKALDNIFGQAYDYTRKYREFQKKMKDKKKNESIVNNNDCLLTKQND